MFQYEVMDEETAMGERFQILKDGEYDAVIQTAIDKVSANSGNPMIDLTLSVYDKEGKTHSVRDFLVFTKSMMWKVIHCAGSSGTMSHYTSGKLCSNVLMNKRVRIKVTSEGGNEIPVDKLNGKPVGSKYPPKNKVEDYLKNTQSVPISQIPMDNSVPEDEDIPF